MACRTSATIWTSVDKRWARSRYEREGKSQAGTDFFSLSRHTDSHSRNKHGPLRLTVCNLACSAPIFGQKWLANCLSQVKARQATVAPRYTTKISIRCVLPGVHMYPGITLQLQLCILHIVGPKKPVYQPKGCCSQTCKSKTY